METENSLPHKKAPAPPVPILWQIYPIHTPSRCLKVDFNIILPSMPRSYKWSFSVTSLLPRSCHLHCSYHSCWFNHPNNICWGVQIIKFPIMKFSPLPCYLIPLRPKYSNQHPILIHSQPTFLPQCEISSFTLIQNKFIYIYIYLNVYILEQQTGRQTILHQMIASIPCLKSAINFSTNGILIHSGCSQIS